MIDYCVGTDAECSQLVTDIAQVDDKNKPLQIYPNPTHNFISIKNLPTNDSFNYRIVDTQGKQWQKGMLNESISVRNLPNGIYILEVQEEDISSFYKFIKM